MKGINIIGHIAMAGVASYIVIYCNILQHLLGSKL